MCLEAGKEGKAQKAPFTSSMTLSKSLRLSGPRFHPGSSLLQFSRPIGIPNSMTQTSALPSFSSYSTLVKGNSICPVAQVKKQTKHQNVTPLFCLYPTTDLTTKLVGSTYTYSQAWIRSLHHHHHVPSPRPLVLLQTAFPLMLMWQHSGRGTS